MSRLYLILSLQLALWPGVASSGLGASAGTFTVGTFNLENYLIIPTRDRLIKPLESRAKVHESILALKADVLAVQEIGGLDGLHALRDALRLKGLDYPHWEHAKGADAEIQVAVISRFPFVEKRSHTNESFLLNGRRGRVARGFAEVTVEVNPRYRFTLLCAHLKSRRTVPEANESELRGQEALLLRQKVDAVLKKNPDANLVVIGDFNDTQDSETFQVIQGKGAEELIDTRPAEWPKVSGRGTSGKSSPTVWTHYYAREDRYSRVDYILISSGMAREWRRDLTGILTLPDWRVASDHRPLLAGFSGEDK